MTKNNLQKAIENLHLKASAELDGRIHGHIDSAIAQSSQVKIKDWRSIMQNRIFKLTAAVIAVFIAVLGIQLFRQTGQAVTLAAVYEKMLLSDAFMYKAKVVATANIPGMPNDRTEMMITILVSDKYGSKQESVELRADPNNKMIEENWEQMYILPQEKKLYRIYPRHKTYSVLELDDKLLERLNKNKHPTPKDMVNQILSFPYTELGKSKIDGIEVQGFKTPKANFSWSDGFWTVVLWVDCTTLLPVRAEMTQTIESVQIEVVFEDFHWNISVSPDDFKPQMENFTPLLGFKYIEFTEQTAIDVLKLFSDSTNKYPEKLDRMTGMSKDQAEKIDALLQKLKDANNLPQWAQSEMSVSDIFYSLTCFYNILERDKKEPAYYGDVVGPADADKVLFRWKTGENEYRVIYGNLTAETVSAQKLAELESQIPK